METRTPLTLRSEKVGVLYTLIIRLFGLLLRLASPFHRGARLWVQGRRGWKKRLAADMGEHAGLVWFHAASLGEFEQGRPVIERMRKAYPHLRILLTFFSPSGYEVRKDYDGVDHVHYLPLDTPGNAEAFLEIVRPTLAVFIRYEYWHNFFRAMFRRRIPVVVVSAVFRPDHLFFKPYGGWSRRTLEGVSRFFVQNRRSLKLLASIGVTRAEVSGDTRFDRVWDAASRPRRFPLVETFIGEGPCLVAGSTWPFDDGLLKEVLAELPGLRCVLVPHHVDEANIGRVLDLFGDEAAVYSRGRDQDLAGARVLVVDTIGMLTHLYGLADLAYVGDGFGRGIHSVLEPAAFGVPIFFGPNYGDFQEAVDLVERGGAFPVRDRVELVAGLRRLLEDGEARREAGRRCRDYVQERTGATDRVMQGLRRYL